MEFAVARPDVIRAVSQRWLLNTWNRLRGAKPLPRWSDLPVDELEGQVDTLMFCDVTGKGGTPQFVIRFQGARLVESYGGDFRGRPLDDALPPAWRANALRTYCQAVTSGKPIYNTVDTSDRGGRKVHMERLLLPFSRNGGVVDRVLASIETLSLHGHFEQRELGRAPNASRTCALVAMIEMPPAAKAGST